MARKKKVSKRKTAKKKTGMKKKVLPDLVKDKFCIALGDSIHNNMAFVSASDFMNTEDIATGTKTEATEQLDLLQQQVKDTGIDDGSSTAKIVPLKTFFANDYVVGIEGVEVRLVCKADATSFKAAVRMYRDDFNHDFKVANLDLDEAREEHASVTKNIAKDQAKFEKMISKYV